MCNFSIPPMNQPYDLFQSVRQSEIDKLDKLSRFLTPVRIYPTAEYIGSKQVKQDISEKKFRPDIFFKLAVLMLLSGFLTLTFTKTFFKSDINALGRIFIYLLLSLLIYGAIKQFFFDRSLNYEILIDNLGITIKEKTYSWRDIIDTAILTIGPGSAKNKYLIIIFKDKSYEKFDLTHFINLNFWGFSSTLSKYIEYFKPGFKI